MKPNIDILTSAFALIVCQSLLSPPVLSQTSVSDQLITLQVVEVNAVSVGARFVPLTPQPSQFNGQGSTRLLWTSNGEIGKVTVARRAASTEGPLRIVARNTEEGRGVETRVNLHDSTNVDFFQRVSRSAGSCRLEFSVDHEPRGRAGHSSIVFTLTSG